jgi:phage protein D/phage baseplate assembly protein gpV
VANESFANTLLVEVEGSPLPADVAGQLIHAYVDDSRNLPDMFVLSFRDPQRLVLAKGNFTIGAKVSLRVQTTDPGGPQPLMTGEITALELALDESGTISQVRGLDLAHRLFRGRRVAAYPDMTVADVVRKVAGLASLQVGQIDAFDGVGGQHDTQISQDNISDWEFLSRLADLVGAQVEVVDGKLNFWLPAPPASAPDTNAKASTDPLVLEADRNLLELRAAISAAEQVPSVEARGWDFEHKQAVTATASPRVAGADAPGADPAKFAGAFSAQPYVAADPSWRSQGVAKAVANALAAELGGACVELSGLAKGNPKLRAGVAVALSNVGDPFAGKYTLTGTRHLFNEHVGYTTAFTVSGRQERSLYSLTSGGSGGAAPDAMTAGLVPAVVSDVRDPLKLGRVKLTMPWLSSDFTSGWARVVQVGAGNARGALVLPEVGDEVLVGFAGGDPDAPYVLGGLHNGQDAVPKLSTEPVDGGNGQIAVRGFVSRTGDKIEFNEKDGVLLSTGDDKLKVKLDKQQNLVLISGAKGVTVDAGDGTLLLKGQTVQIKGQQSVEIEGQKVTVNGTSQAEVTSSGQLTMQASLIKLN